LNLSVAALLVLESLDLRDAHPQGDESVLTLESAFSRAWHHHHRSPVVLSIPSGTSDLDGVLTDSSPSVIGCACVTFFFHAFG
jgi:hypothetical protein